MTTKEMKQWSLYFSICLTFTCFQMEVPRQKLEKVQTSKFRIMRKYDIRQIRSVILRLHSLYRTYCSCVVQESQQMVVSDIRSNYIKSMAKTKTGCYDLFTEYKDLTVFVLSQNVHPSPCTKSVKLGKNKLLPSPTSFQFTSLCHCQLSS